MHRILCINGTDGHSRRLEEILQRLGHETVVADNLDDGLAALDRADVGLVIADSTLRRGETRELARAIQAEAAGIPLILILPEGQSEAAVDRDADPLFDVLTVPLRVESLRAAVDRALDISAQAETLDSSRPGRGWQTTLVGESPEMTRILGVARAVAASSATVLIEGESGTGKEMLVRSIHEASPRAGRPLIAVNCAALPEGLVESSLFGHEKGAFTGASARFIGAFERANGGTLLLDEISELRVDLQAKLLRAIQERQFERVGGGQPIRVDVRIVATSNRDLAEEVRAGRFRSDLYYRLRVVALRMPALRERAGDIPLLIRHFVQQSARELGVPAPEVVTPALEMLQRWSWPGNVRELQHATERAMILNRRGPLTLTDFFPEGFLDPTAPAPEAAAPVAPTIEAALNLDSILSLRELERLAIERALEKTGGHRTRAAQLLGITDRTLRNKLRTWREEAPRGGKVFPLIPAASSGSRGGRPVGSRSVGRPATVGQGPNLLPDNMAA